MINSTAVRLETQDQLAIVTLVQGGRGNPFDGDFCRGLRQASQRLGDDPNLRAVLLRAEGDNFSYGGDLKSLSDPSANLPSLVREWTADLHLGLQRLWQLPVPVVVAAQGFVMGGGAALLAGCDVVLVGASTRVGSAFAQLGFSCDSGSSVALTARMGPARARRFVLLAEVLGSAEALQAGLADRVVADDKLQTESLALATQLAQGPTLAYGEIKRLFRRASGIWMESQMEDEAQTLARLSGSADAREGIAAMVQRRRPRFKGC